MNKYFSFIALLLLSSCTIVRGYLADGAYGPTSFSYEKQLKDTIVNRGEAFSFGKASVQCEWIDTLHFFNQGRMYSNTTMWEAIGPKTETQGVLIVQNDSIVYEKCTGDITPDKIAGVFSVTKSVTSLLCGIAVDEGAIKSVDDAVTEYLPELKKGDPMWQKLTIRHLLDMQSGLDFDDTYSLSLKQKDLRRLNAMAKLNYGRNIPAQVRKLKFRCEPGTVYCNETMTTEILGLVIERATGRRYSDYLEEKVWTPLEMESPAYMNYDSKKHHELKNDGVDLPALGQRLLQGLDQHQSCALGADVAVARGVEDLADAVRRELACVVQDADDAVEVGNAAARVPHDAHAVRARLRDFGDGLALAIGPDEHVVDSAKNNLLVVLTVKVPVLNKKSRFCGRFNHWNTPVYFFNIKYII